MTEKKKEESIAPVEKIRIKPDEDRKKLSYSDSQEFHLPLLIRGTNKQFVPFPDFVVLNKPVTKDLDAFILKTKQVDESLGLKTIKDLCDLKLFGFTEESFVLVYTDSVTKIPMYFTMEIPHEQNAFRGSTSFKRFSSFLGIPYSFSKKSPLYLNRENFQYWQEALSGKIRVISIDIVHQLESVTIQVSKDFSNETPQVGIHAYPIVNIFKARMKRNGKVMEVVDSNLLDRVPSISRIVSGVKKVFEKSFPDINLKLQSYALGYTKNKGDHSIRMIMENEELKQRIKDQDYYPTVSIHTNFDGTGKTFGSTNIYFGFYRVVCKNGVGVYWTESQRQEVQEKYVASALEGKTFKNESEKNDFIVNTRVKFGAFFTESGLDIHNPIVNALLEESILPQMVTFFLDSMVEMGASILRLDVPFENVTEEEFVDNVLITSKNLKFSQEATKFFILEYIAGTITGNQTFKTPLDTMNFLTYLAQAYDSSVRINLEKGAIIFATMLKTVLIDRQHKQKSLFDQYKKQVNPKFLDQ